MYPFWLTLISVGIRKVAVDVNQLLNRSRTSFVTQMMKTHWQMKMTILTSTWQPEVPQAKVHHSSSWSTPPAGDGRKEDENRTGRVVSTDSEVLPQQQQSRSQAIDSTQEPIRLYLLPVIGVLLAHTKFTAQETRLETLHWLLWLHKRLPKRVCLFVTLSTCLSASLSLCLSICLSVCFSLCLSVSSLCVWVTCWFNSANVMLCTVLLKSGVRFCMCTFYCVYEAIPTIRVWQGYE